MNHTNFATDVLYCVNCAADISFGDCMLQKQETITNSLLLRFELEVTASENHDFKQTAYIYYVLHLSPGRGPDKSHVPPLAWP